ncbi:MAG: hypothetical protein DSM107014_14735 [Gomphosphaeria aponina SAG 52.96 = DSM 107014]|uniref:Uncharacterized protein n=1 Tax=Gomphosphaeria aponina SAG 52.96 = DSM 107014 TaxID=1521640 RepID=A0A941GSP2_9CHRO|nr:hypothetical protein [Gomphosphaeria aponina SAG 52.96 = DSM 107014]
MHAKSLLVRGGEKKITNWDIEEGNEENKLGIKSLEKQCSKKQTSYNSQKEQGDRPVPD